MRPSKEGVLADGDLLRSPSGKKAWFFVRQPDSDSRCYCSDDFWRPFGWASFALSPTLANLTLRFAFHYGGSILVSDTIHEKDQESIFSLLIFEVRQGGGNRLAETLAARRLKTRTAKRLLAEARDAEQPARQIAREARIAGS